MGLTSKSYNCSPRRRRAPAFAWWLALLLACVVGAAQALGLGQIQVKSQPGEPLLAEIPIVAGNPSELEGLQVRLASPETFRRVGLQPPDVAASGLEFTVAVDARGAPVIRVTSARPLAQPLLTFLLEVDWGDGRLVREYTALLASPSTVAATPAQPLQAPVVSPPNTIEPVPSSGDVVAEPLPEPDAAAAGEAPATADTAAAAPEPGEASVEEVPAPAPVAAIPPPAPAVAPAPAAPPAPRAPSAGEAYTVRRGDTLSEIAVAMERSGHSLDQTMLALLEANPEAFIGGNINLLKAGAVLRMPQQGEFERYSAGQAAALVREQVAQWRGATAALQPATAGTGAPAPEAPGEEGDATASAEARLQIVPPTSATGEAGTRTGIQAGGEGTMLQAKIQETQETLAARDAEVTELKARVAELEKLQQQQQQLIEMKDSALAAAQLRLAETQAAPAQPAGDEGGPLWPWIVLPLLALLAAGAWWLLRRPGARPRPRPFMAAGSPAPAPAGRPKPAPAREPAPIEPASRPEPPASAPATPVSAPVEAPESSAEPVPEPAPAVAPPPSFASAPAPDIAPRPEPGPAPAPEPKRAPEPVPAMATAREPAMATEGLAAPAAPHWTSAPDLVGAPPVSPATTAAALAAGREQATTPARQVELARAYLDLGDEGAARELLREVLDGRDPVARDIAARMLREL